MVMAVVHRVIKSLAGCAVIFEVSHHHARQCVVMAYCDNMMSSVMIQTPNQVMAVIDNVKLRVDSCAQVMRVQKAYVRVCVVMEY